MKATSYEQVKALLEEYPLIRDAYNRFKLGYPYSIEARNLTWKDCIYKTAVLWKPFEGFYANFQLFFFDENNLFLGQMETKKKFSLKHFFYGFNAFLTFGSDFQIAECTQEDMVEALERIKPARFPRYALMVEGCYHDEFLLLKIPRGIESLQEFVESERKKEPERNRLKIEQIEKEVREALKKEFADEK